MELLGFEVSFEQSGLEFVAELDLLVLDQWTLFLGAGEINKPINCSVMFSSLTLIPFYPYPQLVTIRRLALVFQFTKIPYHSTIVVE